MRDVSPLDVEAGAAGAAAPSAIPPHLRSALLGSGVALAALAALAVAVLRTDDSLTTYFLGRDVQAAGALALVLVAATLPLPAALGLWSRLQDRPRVAAAVLAVLAGAIALAGTVMVFGATPVAYDEVMAVFDAEIFRSGHLLAPVPAEWRSYVPALVPHFVLPVPGNAAWVSAYLPVGALLRAAVDALAHPIATGPLLAGLAVCALVGIGRRLWPERPDAAIVATLLLVTAPQVLFNAMTAFATTAHLALNLTWLWLFLRGGRPGHCGAALTGFLACGLHQVVFHPLFVAPFLLGLILRRRWALVAFYGLVYAVSCAVWVSYFQIVVSTASAAPEATAAAGGRHVLAIAAALLHDFQWTGLDLMAKNLLRFAVWQNPILLPLVALAWPAVRRGEGLARPLAAGIGLTVLAMFVLMPYQGHGWGYRYLHGLIGNACLLAAYGWVRAVPRSGAPARGALGFTCAATLLLVVPGRAMEIHGFVAPYTAAVGAIRAADADLVIVDEGAMAFASDLARNAPDLGNRPKVLLLSKLDAAARTQLCGRGTIALFGPEEGRRLGIIGSETPGTAGGMPCRTRRVPIP